MTLLQIMPDSGGEALLRTTDVASILILLRGHGVRFEQWAARKPLPDIADQEQILAAYRDDVARLRSEGGYLLTDVISIRPDDSDPEWAVKAKEAREKFRDEHTHDEDEVRFFVEGTGCFYLHLGGQVYALICEAGDLLAVPEGTRHWFDMGSTPRFCAIRFFQKEDGWIGNFTGDPVASRIPSLDSLLRPPK